ncbi:UvrD-helicase domain-containing protein [Saccharibacillus sp. JS10]|uniref:HelD family protein n=1 Tax=Saccharibacillus sp. JS10 TaxID=2950552 RepID=UPI00210AE938|nr:UvrD-helicase domain-containing protein [Saccharibacillus sp. JS10]MCQ4086278.1 UvrD-helicase domain-containing protein [Saccharibacillus sp. JS10]
MSENVQSAYREEQTKLSTVLEEIGTQLERLRAIPVYTGHDFTEQVLEAGREERRQRLMKSEPEPYFGRMDFEEAGKNKPSALYIGKAGLDNLEPGSLPIVVDWRAPVASLFYSFTGGEEKVEYEAPEGIIGGEVHLKRNIMVRKSELERVVDTYVRGSEEPAVSDEFLLYRLGENKDNRLRDIVSTIQAEQDQIIRADKNKALIIQGVAGSGKTTVALHRLAFLLYQYQEQVSAGKMIIFAPNSMFLDYISGVLPELGVGDIQQRTFTDWAAKLMDVESMLANPAETLDLWFGEAGGVAPGDDAPGRFKGSAMFRDMLDAAASALEASGAPELEFSPWEDAVLPYETILHWYREEYKHYSAAGRKERVLARIHRWIEMELKSVKPESLRKEYKKKASAREKAYAKKWPDFSPLTLYKQIFGALKDTRGILPEASFAEIPASIIKSTRADLKSGRIREEDLPALLYLHQKLNGVDGIERFDHIVIDEAQDFSPLQVSVLDRFVRGHSFTILGDLSQGIHAYKGVHSWSEMSDLFGEHETSYHALTRSYRSTMEIIGFANAILAGGVQDAIQAVPVFRSGNKVRLIDFGTENEHGGEQMVTQAIRGLWGREHKTVSVLTRTQTQASKLYEVLKPIFPELNLIDGSMTQYEGGLSVLPLHLSKGLEFDAVILADAGLKQYGESEWDAKMLYVGCTRALHELWVLHGGELPKFLHDVEAWSEVGLPE